MTAQDRVRWDAIYRDSNRKPYPAPDPLLLTYTPPVEDDGANHRALDLAAGVGQNGLWLAGQGYTVDVIDISREALSRARAEMAIRNLRNVNLLQVDLDDCALEPESYHVVSIFRYLKRSLQPQLCASVASGGRVIYETFNINYLDIVPEFNTQFLLMPGELDEMFRGWNILHSLDEGHISQVVAVKPGSE
jgi:tellurite methyltransferase